MPDVTVTISEEEVTVLKSFFDTAEDGIRQMARRGIKNIAKAIIDESTSRFSAIKLSPLELRSEIARLDSLGEIPTKAERTGTEVLT